MNSPTHSLIALAVLSRKGQTRRNWAVFIGSLIPDAFIYLCWVWLTFIDKQTQSKIWDEIYFDAPMQLTASIFNSVPIYLMLTITGWIYRARLWGQVLMFFALAALIHIAFDFPVHNHDAYAHFWPFSDWKFFSPLSYYEADHHAVWVSLFETFIAFICIIVLSRRFPKTWTRIILGLLAGLYILMQVMIRLAPFGAAG